MNLVEWLKRVMVSTGPAWVMWLMIILSVGSVAIILERAVFFNSVRDDLVKLSRDLQAALEQGIDVAQQRMARSPSAEAAVVSAGLAVAHLGAAAAEEAMSGAFALQKIKLEKRLSFLATLGNNAPFIGLFGTVIGVVMAFEALDQQMKAAAAANQLPDQTKVMASIGEALVATAVGIAVAIPAVAANNLFQRLTKATLANTEALGSILLTRLKAEGIPTAATATQESASESDAEPEAKPAPAPTKKKKSAAASHDEKASGKSSKNSVETGEGG
ncbi:MAG: MotA/TolQ/ExbB proton channel family protein [Polyangiaceae bacterium]